MNSTVHAITHIHTLFRYQLPVYPPLLILIVSLIRFPKSGEITLKASKLKTKVGERKWNKRSENRHTVFLTIHIVAKKAYEANQRYELTCSSQRLPSCLPIPLLLSFASVHCSAQTILQTPWHLFQLDICFLWTR